MVYSFHEHIADIKFSASGNSLEEMFSESALALREAICEKSNIFPKKEKIINISGNSLENLLYKFLEEFLFLLDAENFVLSEIKEVSIDLAKLTLTATISGDSASEYEFTNEVKAITYSQMEINKTEKGFESIVVLDV